MAQDTPQPDVKKDDDAPIAAPAAPVADVQAAPAPAPAMPGTDAPLSPSPIDQVYSRPPHGSTKSTLAPTSEFTRILLLAFTSRYIFRSIAKLIWPSNVPAQQLAYSLSMGGGSAFLSMKYNSLVKSDIHNLFCETVAYETGKSPDQVTMKDMARSENVIVRRTVHNYHVRSIKRLGSDLLFFLSTPLFFNKKLTALHNANPKRFDFEVITDGLIGVKGGMALGETWNRKTTMFEDIVTFVNNKINPRNGLGQPITVGEVFDLYQHFSDDYHPDRMFKNQLVSSAEEGQEWAKAEPIFRRITELMNHTYAYKHNVAVGDTGKPDANFALPKFIYLLGHDLLRPRHTEETSLYIEVANQYGIPAVRQMQSMLQSGTPLEQVAARFPIAPDKWTHEKPAEGPNKVIAKGSTMQLERSELGMNPVARIDASSISAVGPAFAAKGPELNPV